MGTALTLRTSVWWGFEIALPPPVISTLSGVHSVSSTLFGFLEGFVLSGGAPELAPFVCALFPRKRSKSSLYVSLQEIPE